MEVYPKGPWKAIAEMVATRTVRQTQTHAQKYREKQARRVRGLRNRNGTLQTSLMTGRIGGVGSSFPAHVHTRVYSPTTYSQAMEPSVATMPLARTMSLPAMRSCSSCLPYHYSPYVSATTPVSSTKTSSEFSYRNTAALSSAYIGKETTNSLSSSWTINRVETKQFVPDFDESMDFLMDVYSNNPTTINMLQVLPQSSSAMVTPTAGESRTPQTPMSSVGLKRHPGFGSIPRAQMPVKHFTCTDTTFVNREQGV
uniref:Putative Myb-like protein n=2 Tax=Hyaloperonospora TaxID=184462 RepID=M4C3T1_HYAAE